MERRERKTMQRLWITATALVLAVIVTLITAIARSQTAPPPLPPEVTPTLYGYIQTRDSSGMWVHYPPVLSWTLYQVDLTLGRYIAIKTGIVEGANTTLTANLRSGLCFVLSNDPVSYPQLKLRLTTPDYGWGSGGVASGPGCAIPAHVPVLATDTVTINIQ